MSEVQVGQKSYQMPPQDGFTVAHFLTVADVERSLRFYEKVFGGRILSRGDSSGAPGYLQIANTWLLVNPGGGPTPDKPSVTLSVPANPNSVSSFMNIRVADIQACYKLWRSRGAEFITAPKPKYGETRCYIRDPDGYIIEVADLGILRARQQPGDHPEPPSRSGHHQRSGLLAAAASAAPRHRDPRTELIRRMERPGHPRHPAHHLAGRTRRPGLGQGTGHQGSRPIRIIRLTPRRCHTWSRGSSSAATPADDPTPPSCLRASTGLGRSAISARRTQA